MSCLFYTSHVLWHLGYPDLALEKSREALALARGLSHPFSMVIALDHAAMLHQFRREEQAARERAEAAISLCGDQGFAYYLAWGPIIQGWSLAEQGEDGIAQIQRGLETLQATGARLRRPYYLALLVEACVKAGEAEEGMSLLDEALTAARDQRTLLRGGTAPAQRELATGAGRSRESGRENLWPGHRNLSATGRQVAGTAGHYESGAPVAQTR